MKLAKQGKKIEGYGVGDLYLIIKIQKHPDYHINGNDILHDTYITAPEAVLGAKIFVPTPYGKIKLTIPAGTQSGSRFRISSKGLPNKLGQYGNFYAVIFIHIPFNLTEEEKILWKQLYDKYQKQD